MQPNALKGFPSVNTGFSSHSGHKTAAAILSDFGRGGFGYGGGGCGDGITMLTVEAVGIGGGGRFEGLRGGEKGERNGRQRDDHQ